MKPGSGSLSSIMFKMIAFLLAVKLTFSYINVELGWWLRHLTPNKVKFNPLHIPDNFQELVEYVLLPMMVLYIFVNIRKLGNLILPLTATFLLYILGTFTAIYNDLSLIQSLNLAFKICAPVYLFIVVMLHYKQDPEGCRKTMLYFFIYCFVLILIGLAIFDVSFNRDKNRLPVYFNGIHTHCYIIAVISMGFCTLLRKANPWLLYGFMVISFAFLVLGYNVRTAVVLYFLFIAATLYYKDAFFKNTFAKALAYVPFILGLALVYLRNFDFDKFSSGRLTMYEEKLNLLAEYSFLEYILGRGKGADLITTSEWWYAAKGSHNDYLTFLVEYGVLFTLVFIALIASFILLKKRTSIMAAVLVLGYAITSAISNGLAVRPLAAYMFFILLAYIFISHDHELQQQDTKHLQSQST